MSGKNVKLTAGRTELVLDEHGSIIRVGDAETGRTYFEPIEADRRGFQLVVPSPTWASRSIVSNECAAPVITETGNRQLSTP